MPVEDSIAPVWLCDFVTALPKCIFWRRLCNNPAGANNSAKDSMDQLDKSQIKKMHIKIISEISRSQLLKQKGRVVAWNRPNNILGYIQQLQYALFIIY